MSLGQRIRSRREEKRWSQAELAKAAGTSQQTVNRLELGETEHSKALDGIAEALGVSRKWLLFGDGSATSVDDNPRPPGPTKGASSLHIAVAEAIHEARNIMVGGLRPFAEEAPRHRDVALVLAGAAIEAMRQRGALK